MYIFWLSLYSKQTITMDQKTETEIKEIQDVIELSKDLPKDVFAAVPDEDTVEIKISGAFGRAINKTLEYIIDSVEPEEATRALEYVKVDYKDVDPKTVGNLDVAIWTLMNILNEFNAQAGIQKKTRVYDRDAFMQSITNQANPALPLTDDEIAKRIERNQKEIVNKMSDSDSDAIEKLMKDVD
jgi:argininosuccinate synthase